MTTPVEPLALMACKVFLRASVSSAAKAVAAVLLDRYNWKTRRCDPGFAGIARLAGCSRSGVRKAIDALKADGLLVVVRHGGGSGRNRYDFAWDEIRARDAIFQEAIGYAPNGAQGVPQTGHRGVPQTGHQTRRIKPDEETRGGKRGFSGKRIFGDGQRSILLPFSGAKSLNQRDAAQNAAVQKLSKALRSRGLEAATSPETLSEAVAAELAKPGSGLPLIVDRLQRDRLARLAVEAATA